MLRTERGTGLFSFLAILSGASDTLYAGRAFALHGIGRYVAKPQKVTRSRAPAARYRKSRNGAIYIRRRQILHASNKRWFLVSDFKPFLPENLRRSGTDVGFTVDGEPDIGKTVNGIAVVGKANANKYYLSNYERIKYYPDEVSIYQS